MKAAVVQMRSTEDREANLRRALRLVGRAADAGARLICLPEAFHYRGRMPPPEGISAVAERIPGPSSEPFLILAAQRRVGIVLGSLYERTADPRFAYNTSVFITPEGRVGGVYRKRHLFVAALRDRTVREDAYLKPGRKNTCVSFSGFRIGLSICYDLRFPEMFRDYADRGCGIVCAASAFTRQTGRAHWEVLVRARAIETGCYLLAPNQVGKGAYGHSLIVDPWGRVVAEAEGIEQVLFGEVVWGRIREPRAIWSPQRESRRRQSKL